MSGLSRPRDWACVFGLHIHFVVVYIFVIIFIVLYASARRLCGFEDPLHNKFLPFWESDLDGWAVLHFLTYFVLGYLFPKNLILFTLIGVGWELLEHSAESLHHLTKKSSEEKWWLGKVSDISVNLLGLVFGVGLSPYQ